ncbi:Rha family transcriptional regulator [Acinetobacter soli]|nr:Rha family transcriptional regulator [Acinetobacter soli]WEI12324.1 Rha family transcriptional regulator [Acinetobacter soli]WEI16332.1 Rha family transcriptional regulator [Acinetobacter soli]
MKNAITSIFPSQQMLSSDIALITNIRLDSVKRTIERLAERRVITLPPTVEKPTSGRTSTEYVFSGEQGKLDSITVVAQLCPEFTAAIVKRWYELEQQTPAFDISNPQHLLQAIEIQAKQNLQLTSENKALSQAIETITRTEHGVKFQQACKILNVKQQVLAQWLRKHNWDRYLNNQSFNLLQ